jgi:hypothetical protein
MGGCFSSKKHYESSHKIINGSIVNVIHVYSNRINMCKCIPISEISCVPNVKIVISQRFDNSSDPNPGVSIHFINASAKDLEYAFINKKSQNYQLLNLDSKDSSHYLKILENIYEIYDVEDNYSKVIKDLAILAQNENEYDSGKQKLIQKS